VKKETTFRKRRVFNLEKHNAITQKMLKLMQKPENPFFKALTIAGIGVGILGIIQVIDTILKWF